MKVVLFAHSLISDWNHGNAHFLRGLARELGRRGHRVTVYEPVGGWSLENLKREHGEDPVRRFYEAYPDLDGRFYHDAASADLDDMVGDADLVLVHEWNDPMLVARLGAHRRQIEARTGAGAPRYRLLFHDTHHRSVTDRSAISAFDLSGYDGVLAFGACIRDVYLARGWAERVWVWHEAADTNLFAPAPADATERGREGDLVWVGNWGDEERSKELHEFLIEPVRALGLRATVFGVRYPPEALRALADAGIRFAGWLPNFEVPAVFARYRVTVHVPRRPYVEALPGVPTIRPFEALACGIPLVSAPWEDREHLFRPGTDYLVARDGGEMVGHLRTLLSDETKAQSIARSGRQTILARHTVGHRVDELLSIAAELGLPAQDEAA